MIVDQIDGVKVPCGWEQKYPSLRYYKNRVRICKACNQKFFEIRENVRSPRSFFCIYCSIEQDFKQGVHPNYLNLNHSLTRNKTCASCTNYFLDYTRFSVRKFCYFCVYMFSPEALTKRASEVSIPNFRDKSDEVLKLHESRKSDSEISKILGMEEHQVRLIRNRFNKLAWTPDRLRLSKGFPSLYSLTKDELQTKSYHALMSEYGVSKNVIKLFKRKHEVKTQIPIWYDSELTPDEFQIVLGTSLGDSHLSKRSGNRYSLSVTHKKDHGSYIYWLHDRLATLRPRIYLTGDDLRLSTSPNKVLGTIARSLYSKEAKLKHGVDGQKAPTRELLEKLDSLGLAVLYMDDGHLGNGFISLAIYYPFISDSEIIEPFKKKFGLNFYRRPSTKYSLFLGKSDSEKFLNIVAPHIAPVMSYKLPPSLRPNWESPPEELNGYHSTYYSTLDEDGKIAFESKFFDQMRGKGPYIKFEYDPEDIKNNLAQAMCNDKQCKWSRTGLSLLDEVFPHRMLSKRLNHKSVVEAWEGPFLFSLAIRQLHKYGKIFTPVNIRQELINLVFAPSHFNPSVAASILNDLKPRRVLDPMIGWGGRSLAALCNPNVHRFVGCDLQENSVSSAYRLAKVVRSQVSYDFIATDSVKWMSNTSEKFDLVLTSPPFHNTEIYDGVNSSNTINSWFNDFLVPFLKGCKRVLSTNGRLVLHLEDSGKLHMIKLLHRALPLTGLNIIDTYIYNRHSRIEKEQLLYVMR